MLAAAVVLQSIADYENLRMIREGSRTTWRIQSGKRKRIGPERCAREIAEIRDFWAGPVYGRFDMCEAGHWYYSQWEDLVEQGLRKAESLTPSIIIDQELSRLHLRGCAG